MSADNEEGYGELLMPFMPVQSRGGPYDDAAYTAGYEMGLLDATLAVAGRVVPANYAECTIHKTNQEQADLVAMRHGFKATFTEFDYEDDGEAALDWVVMSLQWIGTEATL